MIDFYPSHESIRDLWQQSVGFWSINIRSDIRKLISAWQWWRLLKIYIKLFLKNFSANGTTYVCTVGIRQHNSTLIKQFLDELPSQRREKFISWLQGLFNLFLSPWISFVLVTKKTDLLNYVDIDSLIM